MKMFIVALLIAISYAQTGCTVGSEVLAYFGNVLYLGEIKTFYGEKFTVTFFDGEVLDEVLYEQSKGGTFHLDRGDVNSVVEGDGDCPTEWKGSHCTPGSIVGVRLDLTSTRRQFGTIVAVLQDSKYKVKVEDDEFELSERYVELCDDTAFNTTCIPCVRHCNCYRSPPPSVAPTIPIFTKMRFTQNVIGNGLVCSYVGSDMVKKTIMAFFNNGTDIVQTMSMVYCRIDKVNNMNHNRFSIEIDTWEPMFLYDGLQSSEYFEFWTKDFSLSGTYIQGIGNFSSDNDMLDLSFDNLDPVFEPEHECTDQAGAVPILQNQEKVTCENAALQQLVAYDWCDSLVSTVCCISCKFCSEFVDTVTDKSRCSMIYVNGQCGTIPGCERYCCLAGMLDDVQEKPFLERIEWHHVAVYSAALIFCILFLERVVCPCIGWYYIILFDDEEEELELKLEQSLETGLTIHGDMLIERIDTPENVMNKKPSKAKEKLTQVDESGSSSPSVDRKSNKSRRRRKRSRGDPLRKSRPADSGIILKKGNPYFDRHHTQPMRARKKSHYKEPKLIVRQKDKHRASSYDRGKAKPIKKKRHSMDNVHDVEGLLSRLDTFRREELACKILAESVADTVYKKKKKPDRKSNFSMDILFE